MKLPQKPPILGDIIKAHYKTLVDMAVLQPNVELTKLVKKINQEHYVYWDKIMHFKNLPAGVTPSLLWLNAKMNRNLGSRYVPLTDTSNHQFRYNMIERINLTLHEIDRGNPKQIGVDLPFDGKDYPRYIVDSLMEEAIASSQLEGAATTREVAKDMLRTGRTPKDNSERMIVNNYLTMQEIKKIKDEPLSVDLILHLHTYLTQGTMEEPDTVGRFRVKGEPVGVYDITDNTELYLAPPAELLNERIAKLVEFANTEHSNAEDFIHPVIKAIILHFWLAYEHPFIDGNGRTARALFYWFMLKEGYWLFEFLSISRIFNRSPMKYMRAFLWTEYDENDLTYFIVFNVKAISWALKQLGEYIQERQNEKHITIELLKNVKDLNERQYAVVSESLQKPNQTFTIELHRSTFDVVYQTARKDLLELKEKGYLDWVKRGKKFFFTPVKDLKQRLAEVMK